MMIMMKHNRHLRRRAERVSVSHFDLKLPDQKRKSRKILQKKKHHTFYQQFFLSRLPELLNKEECSRVTSRYLYFITCLTLILLMWKIWWAPNNASRWQMGFNSAFEELKRSDEKKAAQRRTDLRQNTNNRS